MQLYVATGSFTVTGFQNEFNSRRPVAALVIQAIESNGKAEFKKMIFYVVVLLSSTKPLRYPIYITGCLKV